MSVRSVLGVAVGMQLCFLMDGVGASGSGSGGRLMMRWEEGRFL